MTTAQRCLLSLALSLMAGCVPEVAPPCPDGGTTLTYENFGRPFMNANCNSCHAAAVLDRSGAPTDFTFDTLDQIVSHRDRIYARACTAEPTMPPGPEKPPANLRAQLAQWISCAPP